MESIYYKKGNKEMKNYNKENYYATSDGKNGVAVANLYDWFKVLDGEFNDTLIDLTIWEGRG